MCTYNNIMATKQFKIGEYVVGGIIRANVSEQQVEIKFQDYFTKEDVVSETFNPKGDNAYREMMNFMEDNGTHFYADKVMKFIESKVEVKPIFGW